MLSMLLILHVRYVFLLLKQRYVLSVLLCSKLKFNCIGGGYFTWLFLNYRNKWNDIIAATAVAVTSSLIGASFSKNFLQLLQLDDSRDPPTRTKVNIWYFKQDMWGHASMTLSNDTYISWWPSNDRQRKNNDEKCKIFSSPAVEDRTYAADVKGEERDPDAVISVPNLDEDAIKDWWVEFKDNKENVWHTTDSNCSTIVAKAIFVGGGCRVHEFWRYACFYSTHLYSGKWTPSGVKHLAEDCDSIFWQFVGTGTLTFVECSLSLLAIRFLSKCITNANSQPRVTAIL